MGFQVLLERACDVADDAARARIVERLLADGAAPPEQRKAWYERLLDLLEGQGREEDAYAVVLRAVEELPAEATLWDRAEALARTRKAPDAVAAPGPTRRARGRAGAPPRGAPWSAAP